MTTKQKSAACFCSVIQTHTHSPAHSSLHRAAAPLEAHAKHGHDAAARGVSRALVVIVTLDGAGLGRRSGLGLGRWLWSGLWGWAGVCIPHATLELSSAGYRKSAKASARHTDHKSTDKSQRMHATRNVARSRNTPNKMSRLLPCRIKMV